ncbi:MAG: histidine phosphatase family protein [Gaiellaceae bacterium]
MKTIVITRHAHSTLNQAHRVNGDPSVEVPLTETGRLEARRLGDQLANIPLELVVHTRFGRTRETAAIALEGRPVPMVVEPLLDDIRIGDLEGRDIEDYRAWKRAHTRADRFPGGESLDEAAHRYAQAWAQLARLDHDSLLVVCHEIPIRYALNAAAGSGQLDAPVHDVANATPYLFEPEALAHAAERIAQLAP